MKPAPVLTAGAAFAVGFALVAAWPTRTPPAAAREATPVPPPPSGFRPTGGPTGFASSLSRHAAAKARVATLSAAQARALALALRHPLPSDEPEWWPRVITAWAESEPEAAAAWLQELARHGPLPQEWITAGLLPLACHDLRAAFMAARSLSSHGSEGELLRAAAEVDPHAALAFIATLPDYHGQTVIPALGVWLERDREAALAWLAASRFAKDSMVSEYIVRELFATAPESLRQWLARFPSFDDDEGAHHEFALLEARLDPAAAVDRLPHVTAAHEREGLIHGVVSALVAEGDLSLLDRLITTLPENERFSVLHFFSEEKPALSPERLSEILRMPALGAEEKSYLLDEAKSAFSLASADRLMDLLTSLQSEGVEVSGTAVAFWRSQVGNDWEAARPGFLKAVAEGWFGSSPMLEAAYTFAYTQGLEQLPQLIDALPEAQRVLPAAYLAGRQALENPQAALDPLLDASLSADQRQRLWGSLFNMGEDTEGRSLSLLRRLPAEWQPEAFSRTYVTSANVEDFAPFIAAMARASSTWTEPLADNARKIASVMAEQQPAAALAWTDGLPAGPGREQAQAAAFGKWTGRDAVAASAWLAERPADALRDPLAAALATRITTSDPESAWHWASSITDEATRARLRQSILPAWQAADPAAAAAAAQTGRR